MAPLFMNLHNHTVHSLLDGFQRMEPMVKRAKELGYPALAITDHGNMTGALKFHTACNDVGIIPILGQEFYFARSGFTGLASRHRPKEKVSQKGPRPYYHLTILAKNKTGYHNLCKLSSIGYTEGFYWAPRIDREVLERHHEGLICLSGCVGGELAQKLDHDAKITEIMASVSWYKKVFGDDFYIELASNEQPPSHDIQRRILPKLINLARSFKIKMVATCDSHYTMCEDAWLQEISMTLSQHKTLDDLVRPESDDKIPEGQSSKYRIRLEGKFHLLSVNEMMSMSREHVPLEALDLTEIFKKIEPYDLKAEKGVLHMPIIEDVKDMDAWLMQTCADALPKRYAPHRQAEALERLKYEISVISSLGYSSYFYVVHDVIGWAKKQDIAIGPGRGSAASSIVSYLLDISTLDPLEFGLVFERFLNPHRVSPPDIDIDIAKKDRQDVIKYARDKYGHDKVCQILAMNTIGTKQAIKDVSSVMGYKSTIANRMTAMIPEGEAWKKDNKSKTFTDAMTEIDGFKALVQETFGDPETVNKFVRACTQIEGTNRSMGIHAGGVIIAPKPIQEFLPVYQSHTDGKIGPITSQYDMKDVEDMGLIKFDFLGLRTLQVIGDTCRMEEVPNRQDIPFDDPKTFELLRSGQLDSVFQLEGTGISEFIVNLKPTQLWDIINALALYRPGPMESGELAKFMKARADGVGVYDIPELEPILNKTLGACIYQEDIIQIVMQIAGFSASEADQLRYGIGKKKKNIVQELKPQYIIGFMKHTPGYSEAVAEALFDKMEKFGRYGFNIAHAASYGVITYWTAYLKANYPIQFYAAVLNSRIENSKKLKVVIASTRQFGIKIEPPSVNKSGELFTPTSNSIRFGLKSIKDVGEKAVEVMLADRKANGPFVDTKDFATRIARKFVNKKMRKAMVYGGAFDDLVDVKTHRSYLVARVCGDPEDKIDDLLNRSQLLSEEKKALGFCVSGHPLDEFEPEMRYRGCRTASEIKKAADNEIVLVSGTVTEVHPFESKKGLMAFVSIEDRNDSKITIVVFSTLYSTTKGKELGIYNPGKAVYAYGKIQRRKPGEPEILAQGIGLLGRLKVASFHIDCVGLDVVKRLQVIALANRQPGDIPLMFHEAYNGEGQDSGFKVQNDALGEVGLIVGQSRVKVFCEAHKQTVTA